MNSALTTPLIVGLFSLMALRPPMPRRSSPFNLQFALGYLINEQPFLGLWWLLSGTLATLFQPAFLSSQWWLIVGLTVMDAALLAALVLRARSARPVLSGALHTAFGVKMEPRVTRPSWWRVVLVPVVSWRPDVRRIRNIRYRPAGRAHRLDVYVYRRGVRTDAPVLVYLHGGSFRMGSKSLGAHPLLYRFAAEGWVCISADYRLFRATYRDQLHDTHAVLEWTRAHAQTFGGDPDKLLVAGGSSGAHLAATAALSGATVRGVIVLYGYFGNAGRSPGERSSPHEHIHALAPPFLIVHGSRDTLVLAEDARAFAHRLRAVSRQPVAYAELPGAQHNLDFFHSLRFHSVIDAVADFAALTVGPGAAAQPTTQERNHPSRGHALDHASDEATA
jgi:acetyl esterase/lipase